jgi:hypothetical protein
MSTLEDRLVWHDREIARRIINYPTPTPAELGLTQELVEQRGRLLRMMRTYSKADWPAMADYIDAALSIAVPDGGKPN